jgi:hypothetical protein
MDVSDLKYYNKGRQWHAPNHIIFTVFCCTLPIWASGIRYFWLCNESTGISNQRQEEGGRRKSLK